MFNNFTITARNAVLHAGFRAKAEKSDEVHAGHLLLGVIDADGIGAAALGQDADAVRRRLGTAPIRWSAWRRWRNRRFEPPLSADAKRALEAAERAAGGSIDSGHLALGALEVVALPVDGVAERAAERRAAEAEPTA
ncbi:hypothetical protein L6E12_08670 [Actinokineospora sp. PR83]|uniref:hypothetical protein n=1 Tax=Actinokineospora sp. PR83 TaxID=2884908 RepID=UPI001F1834F9|nr:hypothetical protein [Actinokineospora sp. PR83]MCG8915858.1 hypothetical protein [Actinokineospora sp. PR83]